MRKILMMAFTLVIYFSQTIAAEKQVITAENLQVKEFFEHLDKKTSLANAINKISSASGIVFKVNTDISDENIPKNINAVNWYAAVNILLNDFNFVEIKNNGKLKEVIIIGKKSSNQYNAEPFADDSNQSTEKYVSQVIEGKMRVVYLHDDGTYTIEQ